MVRVIFGLLSLCICATWSLQTLDARSNADAVVAPALERFLTRADEPITSYTARRVLEGANARFKMRASMEAITRFSEGRLTYTVLSETGSEYIREKVLRPILQTEASVLEAGDPARSALTTANYDIGGGELAEPGIVKLMAKPRRKELSLIDGAVFITSGDAELIRVEGRMAKNPSFWTTRVNVVRHYDRVAGVRVPVRLDSNAQIRFAGESTLTMSYKYEMVNGVAVSP